MSIGRVCCRTVDLVHEDETVHEAARRMRDRDVGMLVVVDSERRPVGVLTAQDLVVRALADGPDAAAMVVRAVMTPHPMVIAEEAPTESAVSAMSFGSIRRLPVVDRFGKVVGLVSIDDVTAKLAEELTMIGKLFESQIPHRRPLPGAAFAN
jgi:CBS domain-containing protein